MQYRHFFAWAKHVHSISREYSVEEIADQIPETLNPLPASISRMGIRRLAALIKRGRPLEIAVHILAYQHHLSEQTVWQYIKAARRRARARGLPTAPVPIHS